MPNDAPVITEDPIVIELEFGLEQFHKMVGEVLTNKTFTLEQPGCTITWKLMSQR